MNIFLINGDNLFESQKKLVELVSKEQSKNPSLIVKSIDGSIIKSIQELELDQSISLFHQPKLIIIKRLFDNSSKELVTNILNQIDTINTSTNIFLWEEGNTDKRTIGYKLIAKKHTVIDCKKLNSRDLINWIQSYSKSIGINIDQSTALSIYERVGEDQLTLSQEIKKLKAIKSEKIDKKIIDKYLSMSVESNIFQLIDLVIDSFNDKKYLSSVIKLSDNLLDEYKNYPIFLANLVNQLSNLILIRRYLDMKYSKEVIKDKLKLHPFVLYKLLSKVEKYDLELLVTKFQLLEKLDFEFKSGNLKARDVAVMICK